MSNQGGRSGADTRWRLIWPDDDDSGDDAILSSRMTLPRFFEFWFDPVVLVGERDAAPGTRLLWRDSVAWWQRLTVNPPLADCDGNDRLLASFCAALRKATYTRGKLPSSPQYGLAAHTVRRHIQNVQWLLARAETKGLIQNAPHMKIRRVKPKTKPAFTIEQVRAIFAAVPRFTRPGRLPVRTADFWNGLLAVALIAGVRKQTYFLLEWEWFVEKSDGWWIDFPDHSVPKTDRGICVALPPWLTDFLFRWPRSGKRVFHNAAGRGGRPWSLSHWDDCHEELQVAAGLTHVLPFQAWRRTLGQEMVRLGMSFGNRVAGAALDHRDVQTTEDYYTAAANLFRRAYPPLFLPDDGQRLLFD